MAEKKIQRLDRREFTAASVKALLGGVVITVAGCSGSESPKEPFFGDPTAPSAVVGTGRDVVATISENHGHYAALTSAQIAAGKGVVLDIQGYSIHTHFVALSGAEVRRIGDGQQVSTYSSEEGHSHYVTFN